jgi:hypothetical protein
MCDPATIAVTQFAVSATSAGLGYAARRQQYEAQSDAYKENAQSAREAAINSYSALNDRQIEENKAAFQKKEEAIRETRIGSATAQTAAGEAGVAGLSIERVIGDYFARLGRNQTNVESNRRGAVTQIQRQKQSTYYEAQGRINAMPNPQAPTILEPVLQIFGSGLDAKTTYNKLRLQDAQRQAS